jgi:Predicted transcriptional regulators
MSFSENLQAIRNEKKLSQEQLAELLNVSRQAVSKWENNGGYPETEKLIQMAQKLDVSLDALLLDQQLIDSSENTPSNTSVIFPVNITITVKAQDGKIIGSFYKFRITKLLFTKKEGPKCVICGVNNSNFLGDNLILVGVYATYEDAEKELNEIQKTMRNLETSYHLKYTTSKALRWFNVISSE